MDSESVFSKGFGLLDTWVKRHMPYPLSIALLPPSVLSQFSSAVAVGFYVGDLN
ncbi:hypothetical protein HanIR_Chr14g0690331 [Helianthus annuus]|nr:hypothetical protein HanIR_Chr14g0690331 [Helianthus annuus]